VLVILVLQAAEIIRRYDVVCVPHAYRGNKQAYIKDSTISKNCSLEVKVIHYMIIAALICILSTVYRLCFFNYVICIAKIPELSLAH
jgi:hypothetical protein